MVELELDRVVRFALANLQHGALTEQPGRFSVDRPGGGFDEDRLIVDRGYWDLRKLRAMFDGARFAPDVIVICEAKEWGLWGGLALRAAARVLSDRFERPYVPELGHLPRGLFGPALFYDADRLHCSYFGDVQETVPDTRINLAQLRLRGERGSGFFVLMDHLPFTHGSARLDRTQLLGEWGNADLPLVYLGDLNGVPSGPHWPQRNWGGYSSDWKAAQKGTVGPDGQWRADTEALDRLVGRWVGGPPPRGRRERGAGWHAIPDIAACVDGVALAPTTIPRKGGSGLLIDFGLVNDAWRDGYVPGSYYVEVPSDGSEVVSDHCVSGWQLRLPAPVTASTTQSRIASP